MKEIFTSMYDDQAYQEDPAVDYGRPYNGPQLPVRRSCTGWISKQGTCFLFHIGSCTGWCSKHFFILVPKLDLFIVPKSFCANGSPLYPRLFPTVLCRCALSSPLPGIPRRLGRGRLYWAQVSKNEGHQQPIQPSLDLKQTLQLDLQ